MQGYKGCAHRYVATGGYKLNGSAGELVMAADEGFVRRCGLPAHQTTQEEKRKQDAASRNGLLLSQLGPGPVHLTICSMARRPNFGCL